MSARLIWLTLLICGCLSFAEAATILLSDGTSVDGEPISFNAQGVVMKLPDGSFAPRVGWTNLTQKSLQELGQNPKAKPFVEPFLETDEPESDKPKLEIKPRPVDRLPRPDSNAGIGMMFSSSLSLILLLLVYGGNLYAGYEVALFRNYHPGLVIGLSAVVPIIGPVIFLCLPTKLQKSIDELAAESMAQHLAEAEAQGTATNLTVPSQSDEEANAKTSASPKSNVTVYQRGQTSFNRRFFETKFSGFLRMVPSEAEKDMELYIRSARGEHVGSRLTRILQNELHLQVNKGDATADVIIPFSEIQEVQVRPRSVPAN